ncbi:MAG: hypothetical protein OEV08_01835 [Nitrospira sp.]|nr:hypothetical protein [Nitrospira sp.]
MTGEKLSNQPEPPLYLGERSINRGTVKKNEGEPDTSFELRQLAQRLSLVSEECNMLWWLLSEFSRDEEQPWKNFSAPAITLMAGKELSDLTSLLPGPNAALAFLDRIIRCAKSEPLETVSIKEAVNQVSLQWRQRYVELYSFAPLENLLPLGEAIKLSTISQKKNAWETMFKEKTGISAGAKISPRKLSYQVFIETQLCRCYKESAA